MKILHEMEAARFARFNPPTCRRYHTRAKNDYSSGSDSDNGHNPWKQKRTSFTCPHLRFINVVGILVERKLLNEFRVADAFWAMKVILFLRCVGFVVVMSVIADHLFIIDV